MNDLTEFAESFIQVELSYCHHRNSLRPGSIADTNDQAQFGELKVQGELRRRYAEFAPATFRAT